MADQHPDWNTEKSRLETVLAEMKETIYRLKNHILGVKEGMVDLRKTFWDDVTVNLDEPDDQIETQASMRQQAEILADKERQFDRMGSRIDIYEKMEDAPYFGRFDFKEEGEKQSEPIYIGRASFRDSTGDDFLIYDWRAPISSAYYDYAPGPAQYEAIDGAIKGEMTLKRQYIIQQGNLKGLFDTGLTIGDKLLQTVLGNQANPKMKSIVATIQQEQNRIIRNNKSRVLIVQGVAGSGKTSAALQRIAFLLYRHRKTLRSENILLLSPNPLFNSYVSTVLPELGEENMKQMTFFDYLSDRLRGGLSLEDPLVQMEYTLLDSGLPGYDSRLEGIKYKSGLFFKKHLDDYLEGLSSEGLVFKPITFRGRKIVTAAKIRSIFYSFEPHITLPNRVAMTAEKLLKYLKRIERIERSQDWVEEEAAYLDKDDFIDAYEILQNKQRFTEDTFDDFEREQKLLHKMVVNHHFKPLRKLVKSLRFIDMTAVYYGFFKQQSLQNQPSEWDAIRHGTMEVLDEKSLLWEDATPFAYLQDHLLGRRPGEAIKYLFIDEVQDYSPFQMAYIQELFPYTHMTLLGDINQTIYLHAEDQMLLSHTNEQDASVERIELTRSYRSTKPIVEFTRHLMEEGDMIQPFDREGEKPVLSYVKNKASLYLSVIERIQHLQEQGNETIAIIGKTLESSKQIFDIIKKSVSVQLVDRETYTYTKGVLVIPGYLAKGIEFDGVIIPDASESAYYKESERKLFYTVCTRAMHSLELFSIGESSPFIRRVPIALYDIRHETAEKARRD